MPAPRRAPDHKPAKPDVRPADTVRRVTPAAPTATAPTTTGTFELARDRATLAAALDPIITINTRGIILSASDSLERVFGWKPAELLGKNISVLMPEPIRSAHDSHLRSYASTGKTNIMGRAREFEAIRKDGSLFPIELCVNPVILPGVSGDGDPAFVGIIRDISVQKSAESALQAERRAFETLVSNLPDIVFRLDRQLRHLFIGGAVERISTLAPAEFIGKSGRELGFPPALCDLFEPVCRSVFETGAPGQIEFEVQGTWIQHRLIAEPPVNGVVVSVLGVAEDVTERKRLEHDLAQHRDELESLVAERTAELEKSHEQTRMADRMASLGTLSAGLGHDMNNVLLPVRARLNALHAAGESGQIPPPLRQHVDEIRKSVAYLQQLADGLHFLTLDPETTEDARGGGASTSLAQWWSTTGALLSKAVPKHVRVTASIAGSLPRAALAAHGLTQAVLNLVVNAGEAIPGPKVRKRRQGSVRVWADSKRIDGRTWIRLGVTDNGVGMPDEVKRRAFQMFYTNKPRGMGTGLGLSLVRNVVERVGGKVEIETEVGKGTTVVMTVPAVAADGPSKSRASSNAAAISLSDGRAAAIVRHLLESAGVPIEASPARAGIWILSPGETAVNDAKIWCASHPCGRLVLFGKPARSAAAAWRALHPITVDGVDDLANLRSALNRAVLPS